MKKKIFAPMQTNPMAVGGLNNEEMGKRAGAKSIVVSDTRRWRLVVAGGE